MKESEVSRLFHEIDTDKSGCVRFISAATKLLCLHCSLLLYLLGT